MTPGTGKRSYRACLRCRGRKTRCNLDGVGESKKPPCVSCHHSGSECILVESRRGGNFRPYQPARYSQIMQVEGNETTTDRPRVPADLSDETVTHKVSSPKETGDGGPNTYSSDDDEDLERMPTDEDMDMELRNPSDALQILARSDATPADAPPIDPSLAGEPPLDQEDPTAPQAHRLGGNRVLPRPKVSLLDDYQLVQRGLIPATVLPELLHIYSTYYHPYCPIVPKHLLGPTALETIQRPDYFLLTVILTIASRDSPNHALVHRYCWDYTQRLLLEVLLAHPWTQTPRTVEGLLLLSEWLPHIQITQTTSKAPKNLFSEDRTAWSLIGLAVRHGYMLRLDRAAFRYGRDNDSQERVEQNRLIWTFIYVADRQISVRLGQSFWSRGPALSSHFTANDFPTLRPQSDINSEDYASALEATTDMTQLLHNAHNVLYSSRERTLSMVYDGDYAAYLDDFQIAAMTWHAKWDDIQVQPKIKSIVMLMYEYVCLYVNAFSFQAVLTRASSPRDPTCSGGKQLQGRPQTTKKPIADLFSRGIMSSPDGRFVLDAISAAKNLLSLMNGLDPRQVVRYLPSRYYLYGVYASVFLHKAQCAGAFDNPAQCREISNLAQHFVEVLEQAPAIESHICHGYSRMLKKLWSRREHRSASRGARVSSDGTSQRPSEPLRKETHGMNAGLTPSSQGPYSQPSPARHPDGLTFGDLPEFSATDPAGSFPSIEGYLFGSFFPGLADFTQDEFGLESVQQNDMMSELTDSWGLGQTGAGSYFPV